MAKKCKHKFEGTITLDGTVRYCEQGKHLETLPREDEGDFIKFTSYMRGFAICEGEGYITQMQLDALYDVCKRHKRMDVFRKLNIDNLFIECNKGE